MLPQSLAANISKAIGNGEKLAVIQNFVEKMNFEPSVVGNIFGADELDDLCQDIGKNNLIKLGLNKKLSSLKSRKTVLILVSKLQSSGGHTKAILDLIELSNVEKFVIVASGVVGSTASNFLKKIEWPKISTEFISVPRGNHQSKLDWIQSFIFEMQPHSIWLFNHHHDSLLVAAVQPYQGYDVKFYHHADDRISLGSRLDFGYHFDISSQNYYKCGCENRADKYVYLPQTLIEQPCKMPKITRFDGEFYTCTIGGFNKIEIPYFLSYQRAIVKILKATNGYHVHIGKISPILRFKIKYLLLVNGLPQSKFIYHRWTGSVSNMLKVYKVDLYVTSFPYGGGKTTVEVMAAGVPILAHKNRFNNYIGGIDYVYKDAFLWSDESELDDFLKVFKSYDLESHKQKSRQWFEKFHAPHVVSAILDNHHLNIRKPKNGINFEYSPSIHSWFLCRQNSLKQKLKNLIWRAFRLLKSTIELR